MDQGYKQLLTDLLTKVVALEVEKKQLEAEKKALDVKIAKLEKQIGEIHVENVSQHPSKTPLEKLFEELSKAYPELVIDNPLVKMREELAKNYPDMFRKKEEPKVEKTPLEKMRDEVEKVYSQVVSIEDLPDIGKSFVRILMNNIMDELEPESQ
ncbi:Hypothetical protein ZAZAV_407 [Cedratvirus Zaza IHUMI]|uniref:Uncharacterized protein n=1 Tax=Cedratvirus Zaza IHUMI TaxID=2126979 RepID=A0A2R8FFK0_9VIRU|nr:Hypothetical protein ZAZAV_407 [Cedratvirus Zaza IHUMI]